MDRLNEVFGHRLHAGYDYQHGGDTESPSLVFADADYEVGDGTCGLHEDGKSANEPAIIYVRADAYLLALDERDVLRRALFEYGDRSRMGPVLLRSLEMYADQADTPQAEGKT